MNIKKVRATVYTTPGCGQCVSTIRFLDKNKIPHDTVNLAQDPQALAAVKALGYETAPVIITDQDEHWYGFRPDLLEELKAS